jgi:hypothetical protein
MTGMEDSPGLTAAMGKNLERLLLLFMKIFS